MSPLSVSLFLYACVGLYYRVLRRLHSPEQVIVGFGFGSINAAVVWDASPLGGWMARALEGVIGKEVSWEAAVCLGVLGTLTVGWREISRGKRFLEKKQ